MKVSFYLDRPGHPSTSSIVSSICYNGYQLRYAIGEKINPKYWDKAEYKARKTTAFPEYGEFNERLNRISSDISRVFRSLKNDLNDVPGPKLLKSALDKELKKRRDRSEAETTLLPYFAQMIERTENGKRVIPGTGKPYSERTIKAYRTSYKTLESFAKSYRRKVDFDTVDQNFYEDFRAYLLKKQKKGVNTAGKEIKTLKTVLNDAAAKGIKVNPAYTSRAFSVISKDADTIYLNESELSEMYSLDLSSVPKLERVRDRFIVAANTGLRFDDVNKVKSSAIKGGMITITQGKTGNPVVIPVHPHVSEILAKYGGELPEISNQKFNEYIREVAQMVPSLQADSGYSKKGNMKVVENFKRWELVSSHTARRSFATNQHRKGMSSIIVMAITGHRTERSFLKYIRYTPEDSAIIMKQYWERENQLKAVK
jgi:site-specific recombinase XerD